MLTSGPAAGGSLSGLTWRPLAACDLPGLAELYARALRADGGQPCAVEERTLRHWYVTGVEKSVAVCEGGRLAGACAWRQVSLRDGPRATIVGLVAPDRRGRGIGGWLLDCALDEIGAGMPVRIENEALTAAADALYRSRGLVCAFAEDVMTFDLGGGPLPAVSSSGLTFTAWDETAADRFYAVYEASFRERPGFPGWSAQDWVLWISADEGFRPEWTMLATLDGTDVGFIAGAAGAAGAAGGLIVQVGVVPAARRRSVASTLISDALTRMLADGETHAVLDVNVDNPGAIEVYRRLGFRRTGRRARYETARLAGPWPPR